MVVPASVPPAAGWPGGRPDVRLHLQGRGQEADHRARRCPRRAALSSMTCANSPPWPSHRGAMCFRPVLPEKGLAMLFAPRGVGKTYVALAMAYAIATAGKFLNWSAPTPRSVLYVDGEMPANEMQERMRRLVAAHGGAYPDSLKVLSMDTQEAKASLNLASELDQELVEQIDAEVLILDNRSTLVYSGRENDAESWDAMQPWLLQLRRANRTVLLVDHAGRGGTAARGTSKREDVLDTIIHLKRPSDYEPDQGARFEVHLEKARGIYGDDAKPFEAQLETMDGADHWHVKSIEDANARQGDRGHRGGPVIARDRQGAWDLQVDRQQYSPPPQV